MTAPDGFVLAGGRSSRMGFDKARAAWHGWPMAVAVLDALRPGCGRVALVRRGAPDGLPWLDRSGAPLEVVWEPDAGDTHPLWGVAAALDRAGTELVVVAPCDLPHLQPDHVAALLAAGPAVARADGRRHPLLAVVPRSLAGRARELAAAGASAHALVDGLPAVDLPAEALRNVNTADQLPRSSVEVLLDTLPLPDAAARHRVAAGERARLAARGALAPEPEPTARTS